MTVIRNPVFDGSNIDIGEIVREYNPVYGRIAESGLYAEQGILTTSHMYQIEKQENTKMTKLTSRTERDAMATTRGKRKAVTIGTVTIKETGGVHVEDIQNVLNSWDLDQEDGFFEEVAKEARRLADVGAANMEYIALNATDGLLRDPYDGTVVLNQFTNTGTTRTTHTINAAPNSTTLLSDIMGLINKVGRLNGFNGTYSGIEVIVHNADFDAITSNHDLIGRWQLALQGTGGGYMSNPLLNQTILVENKGRFGWAREFTVENVTFRTYPQNFFRWNGTEVEATTEGKAHTIVHGANGLYQAKFAPAPYVSKVKTAGTKWLGRNTGIIDDTHMDMTLESHCMYFMNRPEMSIDITITK